jgi:hypothetical protein
MKIRDIKKIRQVNDHFIDEQGNIVNVNPIGASEVIKSLNSKKLESFDKFKSIYGAKNEEKKMIKHHCCSKKDKKYRKVTAYMLGKSVPVPENKPFIRLKPYYDVTVYLYEIV